MDEDEARYPSVHAAGLRFVVDLRNPDAARYIIAGGQSGNLFSPHYDDLIPLWRDGEFVSIVGPIETVLELVPSDDE